MRRRLKFLIILMCAAVLLVGSAVSVSAAHNHSYALSADGFKDLNGVVHAWEDGKVADMMSDVSQLDYVYYYYTTEDSIYYYITFCPTDWNPRLVYVSGDVDSYLKLQWYKENNGSFTTYSWYEFSAVYDIATGTITSQNYSDYKYSSQVGINNFTDSLLYCDIDIYSDSSCTEIFFHPAEPPIVATAVAPVKMEAVMKEVLLMIPIGLGCLVLYVGLRKGLAILRQILYQA